MKIILTEEEIAARMQELGGELTREYQGKPLTCIILLIGGFVFAADLLRRVQLDLQVETIKLSSYHGTATTGHVSFLSSFKKPLTGRHLLLIDDILDNGLTLTSARESLQKLGPEDIRTCVFVEKERPRQEELVQHADFAAFHVKSTEFLVGYGLDYNERYRNLAYVAELDKTEI